MALTQENLNLGTVDNDGTGDTLRSGGLKIENNFGDLFTFSNDTLTVLGLSDGDTDFGVFTGTTITDAQNLKAILQELETVIETLNFDVIGQFAGTSTTFAGLPTVVGGTTEVVTNGDFAVLTEDDGPNIAGIYITDGTTYSFVTAIAFENTNMFSNNLTATGNRVHTLDGFNFRITGTTGDVLTLSNTDSLTYTSSLLVQATNTQLSYVSIPSGLLSQIRTSETDSRIYFSDGTNGANLLVSEEGYDFRFIGTGDFRLGTSAGTAGQVFTTNGVGVSPTWEDNFKETSELIVPTAQNTLPNLTNVPEELNTVKIVVNGQVVDNFANSGISVDSSGVFTVNSGDLGYNIEITDRVVAYYKV